ncbi:MAG TPA: efflux RND transporter periplasmic adaptor subunit [Burkholderiaceae bacterium]|nr:efflux RND transporter periplasmic adaptor subunit [Burkholderiaceae bacterium]
MRRHWIWGIALLAVLAAVLTGWLLSRGVVTEAVALRQAPLVRTLQFSARVATLSRVDVGSTITARVAQVLVNEGEQVRRGQVLVQLESDELKAALDQAVASERQARARLAGLRTTGRMTSAAALAQAQATLRAAQAELERSQQLVAQGFISASRLDEARRAVDVARAQESSARAQTRANEEAGTDLAQAEAQLALASAATAAARARLAQARLLAPADARVLSRDVEPGQIVQPGKALVGLALAGPTQLVAQVDERFLEQLRPGQRASVVADAFSNQRFAARVLSLAPAVDAQRGAVEVKFALEQQPPSFLREDMTLSVEVETGRRDRALVMPLAALRGQANESSGTVWVAQEGRSQERSVRLGLRTLDAAEVLEGLSAGDLVLMGKDVAPGRRVRTRPVEWQPGSASLGATREDPGSMLGNAVGR